MSFNTDTATVLDVWMSLGPGVFTLLIWWNYVLQDRGANFRAFETIYFKLTKKIRKNYKNSKKFKNFQNIYVKKHHKNEKVTKMLVKTLQINVFLPS